MRRSGVRPPSAPPDNLRVSLGYCAAGSQPKHQERRSVTTLAQRGTDMATIRRRGVTWQVQVRRQGHATLSRTFRLKADAEQWARQKEAEIDRGELPVDTRVLRSHTLAHLLERYAGSVVPRKRSGDRELYMLRVVLRHPLSRLSLHRLTPTEIAKYRDERLAVVTGSTVRRELAIVRHCLEVARNEWGFVLPSNPVDQVKLPAPNNPRQRRACVAKPLQWL
jgi:hypothetical protein